MKEGLYLRRTRLVCANSCRVEGPTHSVPSEPASNKGWRPAVEVLLLSGDVRQSINCDSCKTR